MLRELKARKARYGFEYGIIRLGDVIPLAKFLEALQAAYPPDAYIAEESGYHEPVLKFYTDNDDVADWMRNYK